MIDLEWAQAFSALFGALVGAAGGIFGAGWRVGRIEPRLELKFQRAIDESEKHIEEKVDSSIKAFDETLRAMRQKMVDTDNDVVEAKLEAERRFLLKDDFNDFRKEEYRKDMDRIFEKLDNLLRPS